MVDVRSKGVTPTESKLADLCQKSFLKLWSYANPFQEDGKEFCDVISVFEHHAFIFFDREKSLADFGPDEDPSTRWDRWKRSAIDRQIATAHGAERYLRSGRPIYLDAKISERLPLNLDLDHLIIHKIIVANGAADACKSFAEENISGSLAIAYGDPPEGSAKWPFLVHLDRNRPVHVFDSHNLPIVLGELDTVKDFSNYLDTKIGAISALSSLVYCGEEDLLGHYLLNTDPTTRRHFVVPPEGGLNGLWIGEGTWKSLYESAIYKATKKANEISYFWDRLINKTCDHWLRGELAGNAELLTRPNAILEMAKEPRFMRRAHVEHIDEAIRGFQWPQTDESIATSVRFFRSLYEYKAYVFLQVAVPEELRRDHAIYRERRREMLYLACGAAKNRFPHMRTIIGIVIEATRGESDEGQDFLLLDCAEWSDEQRDDIVARNRAFRFFSSLSIQQRTSSEFVQSGRKGALARDSRPGRNQECPCGSGKKFKRCCGAP